MKITKFLQISFLIMLAAGAQPAYSAFWQWSKTANTNATIDPTINWAEGMSPSSVNDSARAMMARAAEYRDDISGLLTTAGTSTAYTVTTNQGLCTTTTLPNDGQMIAITVHATNGNIPIITVDGCSAAGIVSAPGVSVAAGSLILGSPYTLKYSAAYTSWMLRDFYSNPYSIPLGGFMQSSLPTPPNSSFILPAGQCISTTTYAAYWVALGSPASGACPGGQFAVLDLRGRSLVALDNLNGSAANRLTSSSLGCGTAMTSIGAVCANGNEFGQMTTNNLPSLVPSGTIGGTAGSVDTNIQRNVSNIAVATGGGGTVPQSNPGTISIAAAGLTFTGNQIGGTAQLFPRVTPIMAVSVFMRVL
jgi:hypothetical protein